jgi:hypothetical protein
MTTLENPSKQTSKELRKNPIDMFHHEEAKPRMLLRGAGYYPVQTKMYPGKK